eukprot:10835574-Prorocentrum_lima.AAC.1
MVRCISGARYVFPDTRGGRLWNIFTLFAMRRRKGDTTDTTGACAVLELGAKSGARDYDDNASALPLR